MRKEDIKIEDLLLDDRNPRFGQLYSGNSQADILTYLLDEEDAFSLAKKIADDNLFRMDKPLLVLEQPDGKYLVRDGNRRCAAAKALQDPAHVANFPKLFKVAELPTIVYSQNEAALLNEHVMEIHTTQSVKQWSTIAKALEVLRLSKLNASETELKEFDTNPSALLKVANFYLEAVKIGGEPLKELLRNSGKKGRKWIIFERLFQSSKLCGYSFGTQKDNYDIVISDRPQFEAYIKAVVEYLQLNPGTTHAVVDKVPQQRDFLFNTLGLTDKTVAVSTAGTETSAAPSLFPTLGASTATSTSGTSNITLINGPVSEIPPIAVPTGVSKASGSIPTPIKNMTRTSDLFPGLTYIRPDAPSNLQDLISECKRISFNIEPNKGYPFASMALLRMAFENSLNFVLTATKGKSGPLDKRRGMQSNDKLSTKKTTFTSFITNSGIKRKFESLDLEHFNIVIHSGWPTTNKHIVNCALQVETLVAWMLQDQTAFEAELDSGRL